MAKLTDKERKAVEILIRLGDSKELATKTIIADRKRNSETSTIYGIAFCS